MLSSELLTECCEELLSKRSECPEALESLVALIMVAGPKFDDSARQYHSKLDKIFLDMTALTKDKTVAPRLRFLIRDVLDARTAGWPMRRSAEKMPAKLEDVRNAPINQPRPIASVWSTSMDSEISKKEEQTPTGEAAETQKKVVKSGATERIEDAPEARDA